MSNQAVLGQLPLPRSVPPRTHSSSLQPAPRTRLRHVEETVLERLAAVAAAELQISAARGKELLALPLLRQELA